MTEPTLHADLTVADVLDRWPQTLQVFASHQMACAGCAMAPFSTLDYAASVYGLDTARFIAELQQAVAHTPAP